VDAHPIHFHLFDVQVLNRVGWTDSSDCRRERTGLEGHRQDAPAGGHDRRLRPVKRWFLRPSNSIRPLNPAMPLGSFEGFSQIDSVTGNAAVLLRQIESSTSVMSTHALHILSHEENDMMRPIILQIRNVLTSIVTAKRIFSGTILFPVMLRSGL